MKEIIKKIIFGFFKFCGVTKKKIAFPVFRYNIYTQDGDDGIIEFILKKVPNIPKYVVDIGANDGETHSNSRLLIHKYGFGGLLIEPFADAHNKLKNLYKNEEKITISNMAVGEFKKEAGSINWHGHFQDLEMPIVNVNDFFESQNIPTGIGFLSIDIDGHDNEVLAVLDWRQYSPYFVIAEIDSSSDKNLQDQINIMDRAGYYPLLHIGNVFYCRKDLMSKYLFNWRLDLPNEFGLFWR